MADIATQSVVAGAQRAGLTPASSDSSGGIARTTASSFTLAAAAEKEKGEKQRHQWFELDSAEDY